MSKSKKLAARQVYLGIEAGGTRTLAAALLAVCGVLLVLAALSLIRSRKDWRNKLAEAEGSEAANQ